MLKETKTWGCLAEHLANGSEKQNKVGFTTEGPTRDTGIQGVWRGGSRGIAQSSRGGRSGDDYHRDLRE